MHVFYACIQLGNRINNHTPPSFGIKTNKNKNEIHNQQQRINQNACFSEQGNQHKEHTPDSGQLQDFGTRGVQRNGFGHGKHDNRFRICGGIRGRGNLYSCKGTDRACQGDRRQAIDL